jgi:hypothetical protein
MNKASDYWDRGGFVSAAVHSMYRTSDETTVLVPNEGGACVPIKVQTILMIVTKICRIPHPPVR